MSQYIKCEGGCCCYGESNQVRKTISNIPERYVEMLNGVDYLL